MAILKFPDPREADENGLLAIGGDLDPETLLTAYRGGIFPWPNPEMEFMIWASPRQRGVLDFADLRISRTFSKAAKKEPYTYTIDKCFQEVISRCSAKPRPGQAGTWITPEMRKAYCKFHELGYAHSVEAWDRGKLVGGLYGVDVDGAFAGESMFFEKANASKLALLHLIEHLESRGATWIDIQVLTPHMEQLGAKLIPQAEFLSRLAATRTLGLSLFPPHTQTGSPGP